MAEGVVTEEGSLAQGCLLGSVTFFLLLCLLLVFGFPFMASGIALIAISQGSFDPVRITGVVFVAISCLLVFFSITCTAVMCVVGAKARTTRRTQINPATPVQAPPYTESQYHGHFAPPSYEAATQFDQSTTEGSSSNPQDSSTTDPPPYICVVNSEVQSPVHTVTS